MSVAEWFVEQVTSGTMLVALPVAAAAGLVSFLSPCVVPLLPGYVSYATGLSGADLEHAGRGRMLAGTTLFVLGFTAWFVVVGVTTGALGAWLWEYKRQISIVLGAVTVLVGLVFMGLPWLQRDVRIHAMPAVGLSAAPLLGLLFAIGWTPCLGPTIIAVQSLAISEGTVGRGVALSTAYSLGLGLPFILIALGARWAVRTTGWLRSHVRQVQVFGGVLLIAVGAALVTGLWGEFVGWLRDAVVNDLELPL